MRSDRTRTLLLAARIALGAVFVFSGIVKLADLGSTAEEMQHFDLPFPYLTGLLVSLLQLGAGGLFIAGRFALLSAFLLAGFTLAATFLAHGFWGLPAGEAVRQATTFLEHLGMIAELPLAGFPTARQSSSHPGNDLHAA